jgi:hypothetical protein
LQPASRSKPRAAQAPVQHVSVAARAVIGGNRVPARSRRVPRRAPLHLGELPRGLAGRQRDGDHAGAPRTTDGPGILRLLRRGEVPRTGGRPQRLRRHGGSARGNVHQQNGDHQQHLPPPTARSLSPLHGYNCLQTRALVRRVGGVALNPKMTDTPRSRLLAVHGRWRITSILLSRGRPGRGAAERMVEGWLRRRLRTGRCGECRRSPSGLRARVRPCVQQYF